MKSAEHIAGHDREVSEEEAIEIANDTVYGLAGGVWSGDPERAKRVARRIRAGQVEVNGGAFNVMAPFGGYKRSGLGRENGQEAIMGYLQTKAVWISTATDVPNPFVMR